MTNFIIDEIQRMAALQVLQTFLDGALSSDPPQLHLMMVELARGWNQVLQDYEKEQQRSILISKLRVAARLRHDQLEANYRLYGLVLADSPRPPHVVTLVSTILLTYHWRIVVQSKSLGREVAETEISNVLLNLVGGLDEGSVEHLVLHLWSFLVLCRVEHFLLIQN